MTSPFPDWRLADVDVPDRAVLGVDIGGSGIKGALVDPVTGQRVSARLRLDTPQPATPQTLTETVGTIVGHFEWSGPLGCTFPGVVRRNVILTAVNLHESLEQLNLAEALASTGCSPVRVINDADAAGLAEMRHGAGRTAGLAERGTVIMITLGTGVGSALFHDGVLVPNTELGHLEVDGEDAELTTSARYKDRNRLAWSEWTPNVSRYLRHLEFLLSPELIIIGGGISKSFDLFAHQLDTRTPLVQAELRNNAGIVGAAMFAADPDQA